MTGRLITLDFHGDTLFAVNDPAGALVAPKPISDALGLAWNKQLERIKRDPVLAEGMTIMGIPSPGGEQQTTMLRLHLLPGWLFGIGVNQVKLEARDKVLAYKRECHAVLFAHFHGGRGESAALTGPTPLHPAREETVPVRRSLVTEARQTFGARAAGSLWFALGLPIVSEMQGAAPQGDLFSYRDETHTARRLPGDPGRP